MEKLFSSIKEQSGKIGIAIAVLTLAWSSIGGYVESTTQLKDIQSQQEKRISDLEAEVKNEMATRREIQEFKTETRSRFDRIENLLLKELEAQHKKF